MRFLIDNNLSPALAKRLNNDGHDAVHIYDYGMHREKNDNKILDRAAAESRILIARDTDFGKCLHQRRLRNPSVIHLPQDGAPHRPAAQHQLLVSELPELHRDLTRGAHVTITGDRHGQSPRVEIRRLPLHQPPSHPEARRVGRKL